MPRYINADSLYERLESYFQMVEDYANLDIQPWYIVGLRKVINALKNEPAETDVREVKHVKWIQRGEDAVCSNCGQLTEDYCIEGDSESGYYTVLPHYCSACGALMDLEDD